MIRHFETKERDSKQRKSKPIILLIVEGQNKTENLYFRHFIQQNLPFNLRIITPGRTTDPKGMLEHLQNYWKRNGLDEKSGDLGYIILDLDCNDKKGNTIRKLNKGLSSTKFIISNPCFEVWFLLHYKYTTHIFKDGSELITELRKHIKDYEKNKDIYALLLHNTATAIENSKKLVVHFNTDNSSWPSNTCNPRTDVHILLEMFNKLQKS